MIGRRRLRVVVVVVERQRRRAAVALHAAGADARVQDRDARHGGVAGRGAEIARVTDRTHLRARDRHVVIRQRGRRGPDRGVVAERAVAFRLARRIGRGDVIRRAQLQGRAAADVILRAGVVAGVAGGRHEGMLRRAHGGIRSEAARNVGLRMAGTAVGAGEVRNVRQARQYGVFRRVVVVPSQCRGVVAMALTAVASDSGVQHGDARQGRVTGFGGADCSVADRAGLGAGSRHVIGRLGRGAPIGRVVASGAVPGDFLRIAAREVARGADLQRRSRCAQIEARALLVAGIARRRHEGMFRGAHVRGPEAAAHIIRRMAGTAIGAGQIRDVRRRQQCVLGNVVVVPGEHRGGAVAGAAAAVDAGMQRGDGRQGFVIGQVRMAHAAGCVAGVRHMTHGQRVAVPVRRGVANAAVVGLDHLPRGVIGRAALERGVGGAHGERQPRLMAGIAGRGHE